MKKVSQIALSFSIVLFAFTVVFASQPKQVESALRTAFTNVDQFGYAEVRNSENEADLASHYPFSPQRWRVATSTATNTKLEDANRVLYQYNTSTPIIDHQALNGRGDKDVTKLSVSSSEVAIAETAESFRYEVGYVEQPSNAIALNQVLKSGDELRFGPFDGQQGYGIVKEGNMATKTAELFIMRNGTDVATTTITLEKPLTDYTRFAFNFNWYNVGNLILKQTYTDSNFNQQNVEIGKIARQGKNRGPAIGNLPFRYQLKAAAGTTDLSIEAGSVAVQTKGTPEPISKLTTNYVETSGTKIDATDTFVPVHATRVDPSRNFVAVEVTDLNLFELDCSGDVQLTAQSIDKTKTDATTSSYSAPPLHSRVNSVLEETSDVTTFPDSSGSIVDSATDPGGYQLSAASLYTQGTGNQASTESDSAEVKRNVFDRDIVVFLAKSTCQGDIKFNYQVEQDW